MKLIVQPEAGLDPVLTAIARARQQIDLAVFRLDCTPIEKALGAAVERGVRVRALVAHTNHGGEHKLRKLEQRLLDAGVSVTRTGDDFPKYHGKYMLLDNSLHLFGFNLTRQDMAKSRSFGIQTRDSRAFRDARALFDSDVARQPYTGSASSPFVVSPETSRVTLQQFIGRARDRLSIYDTRLNDGPILKLLQQRAAAGVRIRILGKASRLPEPIEVRKFAGHRLHVRAIVRDESQVFVGSQSLRGVELDQRREVGLIVTNPAVARRILDVFDDDWTAADTSDGDDT